MSNTQQTGGIFSLRNIIILLALVAIATLVFYKFQSPTGSNSTAPIEVVSDDHTIGPDNSLVTFVEFADLQCPSCKAYSGPIKEAMDKYKDRVQFVYRYFPLIRIHPNAMIAAQAAEAAGNQGKFFEMVEVIFANQNDWSNKPTAKTLFVQYATDLGLDVSQFEKDIAAPETEARVKRDLKQANALGLSGTPTFYVNGRQVSTSEMGPSVESISALLDAELAKASQPNEIDVVEAE